MKTYAHFIVFFIALHFSCKAPLEVASNSAAQYKITQTGETDTISAIVKLLKPYRDSLDKNMNEVIGYATGDFVKEKPSGSLGNLVVDAMFNKAKGIDNKTYNAIMNYGGIRIPEIKEGNITVGKIFELSPFENELVIVEINGKILKQWYKLVWENAGWPMFYKLKEEKQLKRENGEMIARVDTIIERVFIYDTLKSLNEVIQAHGPIIDSINYFIATNDYVANGGDNCDFLKNCKRTNTGILIRDLLIDYIRHCKQISPSNFAQTIKKLKQ